MKIFSIILALVAISVPTTACAFEYKVTDRFSMIGDVYKKSDFARPVGLTASHMIKLGVKYNF